MPHNALFYPQFQLAWASRCFKGSNLNVPGAPRAESCPEGTCRTWRWDTQLLHPSFWNPHSRRTTVDSCEILHQLIGGWDPIIHGVSSILRVMQDFATIHSMKNWSKDRQCTILDGIRDEMSSVLYHFSVFDVCGYGMIWIICGSKSVLWWARLDGK